MLEEHLISILLIGTGCLAVFFAVLRLVISERRYFFTAPDAVGTFSGSMLKHPSGLIVLMFVLAFFFIGYSQIESRSITHVESYVPGLNLPAGISEPPPRIGFFETVRWHWHAEPHPPGYFLMMWGCTKLFGTSLTAIRIPGLLFGCLSIVMMYLIGARICNSRWAGVLAAGLLAFNGHHLHWALMARQYEPAMALGLVSLWLWLKILSSAKPGILTEFSYVCVVILGLSFHVLFWVFLLSQMVYTVAISRVENGLSSRTLYCQTLSILLASPLVFHALYIGRSVQSGGEPSLAFTQDYLNFGFLLQRDPISGLDVPWVFETIISLVALWSLVIALKNDSARSWQAGGVKPLPPVSVLVGIAFGAVLILLALMRVAWRYSDSLWFAVVFPVLAVAGFLVLKYVPVSGWWPRRGLLTDFSPLPVVALLSLLFTYLISIQQPAAVSRGLLIAVPPLLLTLASGIFLLVKTQRTIGVIVLALLVVAHGFSLIWYRDYERFNDYRGLAQELEKELWPDDRIFVAKKHWATTPLFYYLPAHYDMLVAEDYRPVAATVDRVWLIVLDEGQANEIRVALSDFRLVKTIDKRFISAKLFQKREHKDDL